MIIDQDAFGPGGSNMQSILMVLQAPDVELLGVMVESGDGWQKENVAHTLRLLELVGRKDVPVIAGSVYPLINSEEETKRWEALYGKLGYKGAWMEKWPGYNTVARPPYHGPDVIPPMKEGEPMTKPAAEVAANFLVRKLREFPGEISILAMGPLTNLALAVRLDPGLAAQAKELVLMGGSFNPVAPTQDEFALQFVNTPRVEFNFRWDPEAARIALRAGWKKITQVPLDATTETSYTPALAKAAAAADTPVGKYLKKYAEPGYPMWDEVAAAVWLDPKIVKHQDELSVDVDIDHGPNYGATLSWQPGAGPGVGEPKVTVVRTIDVSALEKKFVEEMTAPSASK